MSSFEVIEKIDELMGTYYSKMHNHSYFDKNGTGRFRAYCNGRGLNDKGFQWVIQQKTASCHLVDFDQEFPSNIEEINEREKHIHKILKDFYKITTSEKLKLSDFSIIKHPVSWNNILEIVHLEFDEKYKESLQTIIGQNVLDQIPKNEELIEILKEFQNENNLPDDQYKWILAVVEFQKNSFNDTSSLYRIFENNEPKNDIIETMIEVYGVHKIFIQHSNKTWDYTLNDFENDLKINNNDNDMLNANKIGSYLLHSHYPRPIDLRQHYLIDDDMESITNYLIATTYFINNAVKEQNIKLIIIPKIVKSAIDKNKLYKHKYLKKIKEIKTCLNQFKSSKKIKSEEFYEKIKKYSDQNALAVYQSAVYMNDQMLLKNTKDNESLIIIIDRMQSDKEDIIKIYNEDKNEIFDKLMCDYSLSFMFDKRQTIKSYIYWGSNQRGLIFIHSLCVIFCHLLFCVVDKSASFRK